MLQRKEGWVVQCGREISRDEIVQIQETIATFGGLSRQVLAQTVCEHLEWRTASGSNKVDACLKLLEKLELQEYFRQGGSGVLLRASTRWLNARVTENVTRR